MTDSVDLSWLNDINNPSSYFLKEPLTSIDVFFIYINKSNSIDKTTCESHPVINNILEKENLIGLIQKKRNPNPNTRYKLLDTMLFYIDIEPNEIMDYANSKESDSGGSRWLKSLPIIDDVVINPAIELFHDTNSIFIILQEMTPVKKVPNKPVIIPPSILKSSNPVNDANKKTKRVRISPEVIERQTKSKKTLKQRET
jgi:hypothetical protein